MTDAHFWNQLLARRDAIAAIDPDLDGAAELLAEQLATVAEQYDRTFDPADDFAAYVAVALCRTVAAKIEALSG